MHKFGLKLTQLACSPFSPSQQIEDTKHLKCAPTRLYLFIPNETHDSVDHILEKNIGEKVLKIYPK